MGPTRGPYILQVCMGPSYFWRGLTPPDPPLFRALLDLGCCKKIWFGPAYWMCVMPNPCKLSYVLSMLLERQI